MQHIGILGGMGPLAGATLALRLVQLMHASKDQEHIPVVLVNDPNVPSRNAALLDGGKSPLPSMVRGIHTLVEAKSDCIIIPCNTAHMWFDKLQEASPVPLLHIVKAVIHDLRRHNIKYGGVGILGTPATIKSGLYQRELSNCGYKPITPTIDEVENLLVPAIESVKANQVDDAYEPIKNAISSLKGAGARAVILGCTELPLAIPISRRSEMDIMLSDSIDALALMTIDWISK